MDKLLFSKKSQNSKIFEDRNESRYMADVKDPVFKPNGEFREKSFYDVINSPDLEHVENWQGSPDYIIFKDGTLTKALNGSTGKIDSSNTDSITVIQYAIDQLTTGGHIHIKKGSYELDDNILLDDYITLSGEGYSTELKFTTADKTIKLVSKTNVILENFRVNGNASVVGGSGINISGTGSTKCIIHHVFSHNAGADGIGFWQNSSYCSIENCITWDNGTNGCFIEGTGAGNSYRCRITDCISITDGSNGVRFSDSEESIVKGNIIFQCGATGILVDGVDESVISNNIIFDPVNGGILASTADDLIIANNQVYQTGAAHMAIALTTGNRGVIIGNVVKDAGASALDIQGTDHLIANNSIYNSNLKGINLSGATGCIITGNFVDENGQAGIEVYRSQKCTITGNVFRNNSQGAAGGNYGIKIWDNGGGTPCTNLIVTDNLCYDNQGTKTQGYGIRELDSSDYNIYAHNMLSDNLTGAISIVGTNSKIIENLGYVTENSGSANMLNGNSTVVVTHGLATTPTSINVVGTTSETNDLFVTAIGATTFTINSAAAVTADTTIYWEAKVR